MGELLVIKDNKETLGRNKKEHAQKSSRVLAQENNMVVKINTEKGNVFGVYIPGTFEKIGKYIDNNPKQTTIIAGSTVAVVATIATSVIVYKKYFTLEKRIERKLKKLQNKEKNNG